MSTLAEKRVFDDRAGETTVYLASSIGVVTVAVADDRIGRFAVDYRCSARGLAANDGVLAVATENDVLATAGDGYEPTGFGRAVAVGFDGDALLAADPDGRVARTVEADDWVDIDRLDAEVRAIDGDLLATDAGVYRAADRGLTHVGLDEVTDVSGVEDPLAATDAGLYGLGNGWMSELDGEFRAVSAGSRADRACAATEAAVFVRDDGDWDERALPVEGRVADVAVAENAYVATATGEFLVDAGSGWRSRSLGIRDVKAVAVP